MTHISVKNGNDFAIKGRYDGQDYSFPPGEPVAVPVEVANHVFGWGQPDKTRALHRLGWLSTADSMSQAQERMNRIIFEEVVQSYAPKERKTQANQVANSKKPVLAEGGNEL